MGLTITADYKEAPEWDMGYASFFRLRRDIAYTVSKEFGDHYADITSTIYMFDKKACEEYDRITDYLIKKYRLKKRFVDFLYAPDCGYRLSPMKCKAVLLQIGYGNKSKNIESDSLYGYAARPESCMRIEDFIDLLATCSATKKYLIWY
ncbi:MAG: hypothetical protein IKH75_00890 [Ruminococcus sp.]|nr:hypothetical protein [Ruminococcus sp.]